MDVFPTMRANDQSGRLRNPTTGGPPTYRYSNFFKSFANLNLTLEDLGLTALTDTHDSLFPSKSAPTSARSSLESCDTGNFTAYGDDSLEIALSANMMKGRTLSLRIRRPLFKRVRTPSVDSTSSLPTIASTSSTLSMRSKRFLAKVPKMFAFELPFGSIRVHKVSKASKVGHGYLTRRHRKPSTLDFRCIGMAAEDDFYFMGSPSNSCEYFSSNMACNVWGGIKKMATKY